MNENWIDLIYELVKIEVGIQLKYEKVFQS